MINTNTNTNIENFKILDKIINTTGYADRKLTGGASILTIAAKTGVPIYKISLYFGYENSRPVNKLIEVSEKYYRIFQESLQAYIEAKTPKQSNNILTEHNIDTFRCNSNKGVNNITKTTKTIEPVNTIETNNIPETVNTIETNNIPETVKTIETNNIPEPVDNTRDINVIAFDALDGTFSF